MSNPALEAYKGRDDLLGYGANGLALFALQLHLGIEDIDSVAATSLTDGPNDKKCDIVHVDKDRECVVVGQSYVAQKAKSEASASKASDLNTAVSWILSGDLAGMPEAVRSAALEVREALKGDQVRSFEVWYVHNCPESSNVKAELNQAALTASNLLKKEFPGSQVTSVVGREVGQQTLERWYTRTEVPILVTDEFDIPVTGGFLQEAEKWSAFCTSVQGSWLRAVWKKHETDLLSPNVRDYLGMVKSEKNINYGIKTSARQDASQFWIYNNGLTIVVNDINLDDYVFPGPSQVKITGLGIVNGAQTTGTLGTLSDVEAERLDDIWVMTRFVKCQDADVLRDIVRFNNTQNKVEAADFRSNDATQDRLRKEFEAIPDAEYRGGRRGGVRDAIERKKNLLANNSVAQALAAFHGKPNLAYNDTRLIWTENGIYDQYFSDKTTARNIVLCFSLLRTIEEAKQEIQAIAEGKRTDLQRQAMSFFRRRGSIHLLVAAMAQSLESIVGHALPDRFAVRFSDNCSPRVGTTRWRPVVDVCLPFCASLVGACDRDLQNSEKVRTAVDTFSQLVAATATANKSIHQEFAKHVETFSFDA